jgi:hypothetical protein
LKDNTTFTLDATRRDAGRDQNYIFPVTMEKSLLDFQTRHLTLGRWSSPVARPLAVPTTYKEDTQSAVLHPTINYQELNNLQAQVTEMFKKSETSPKPPKKRQAGEHEWAFTPEDRLVAHFGHVLFPVDSVHTGPGSSSAVSFVPSLPGLANILTGEDFQSLHRPKAPTLDYTFIAAPMQQSFPIDQEFPTLTVQFRFNERTGQHFLGRLSLGFDKHIHDVLLPNKSLDIRFHRHTRLQLLTPGANKKLQTFTQTVLANIQSGERLTAPDLEIEIPKWTMPGYAHAHLPGTRSVRYLFTGIRFRQSVAANLLNTRVSISTTQSGKLGKKGVSLSTFFDTQKPLDSGAREHSRQEKNEDALQVFLGSCFKVVDKITESAASTQAVGRSTKTRDEFSARKLRRQGLGGIAEEGTTEQRSVPAVEGTADQNGVESAPINGEAQSVATLSQLHSQVDDPYLAGFLYDEPLPDKYDESSLVSADPHDDSVNQDVNRSLKAAA